MGKLRRVLEAILKAGQPLHLTADTLITGFPPERRFHRELLGMLDYRTCVEEELGRTFPGKLTLATAFHPESHPQRRW